MSLDKISQELNLPQHLVEIAQEIDNLLTFHKIPHSIIGGIAVGSYSKPRTTADVDFLVPSHSLSKLNSLFNLSPLDMGSREGVYATVDGVEVDFIFARPNEEFLFQNPVTHSSFQIPGKNQLLFLKLDAGRTSDSQDIIRIVAGMSQLERADFLNFLGKIEKDQDRDLSDMKEDFNSLVQISDLETAQPKNASRQYRSFLLSKLGKPQD